MEGSASPALLAWDQAEMEESDQVSAGARVPSMPTPSRPCGWHWHSWAVLGSRWQPGRVQQTLPLPCRQLSLGGHAKTPGIILGTKTGQDWPEQSGQASRARSGKEQERQVWERDSTSSEFPPNSLCQPGLSFHGQITWT